MRYRPVLCPCGSNRLGRELIDARGIFTTYICDECEERKRAQFRPDVFDDPNYWADEPIDA